MYTERERREIVQASCDSVLLVAARAAISCAKHAVKFQFILTLFVVPASAYICCKCTERERREIFCASCCFVLLVAGRATISSAKHTVLYPLVLPACVHQGMLE